MNDKDLTFLEVFAEGEQHALEFLVNDRTFQILGRKGAAGLYERFFHKDSHPTRRRVSRPEMLEALQKATSQLEFYLGEKGSGKFFATSVDALDAAKKWLGAT